MTAFQLAIALAGAGGVIITGLILVNHSRLLAEQNVQIKAMEDGELERRRRAAISLLPIQLSAVHQYAEDCLEALETVQLPDHHAQAASLPRPQKISPVPLIPPDQQARLVECAAIAPSNIRDELSILVAELQVQHANFSDFRKRLAVSENHNTKLQWTITKHDLATLLRQAVALCDRADGLFDFARSHAGEIFFNVEADRMMNRALFRIGRNDFLAILEEDISLRNSDSETS